MFSDNNFQGKFKRLFVHEGNSKGGEPVNEMIWHCNVGAEGVGFDRVPVVVCHTWSFLRGDRDRGYERQSHKWIRFILRLRTNAVDQVGL